jgi:hypothetical protein
MDLRPDDGPPQNLAGVVTSGAAAGSLAGGVPQLWRLVDKAGGRSTARRIPPYPKNATVSARHVLTAASGAEFRDFLLSPAISAYAR